MKSNHPCKKIDKITNAFTNLRYVEQRLKRTLRPEEYEEYVEEKLAELHKSGCYVYESLDFSWDE